MAGDSIRIAVDATNLRAKGGLTHLRGLLNAGDPRELGVHQIDVWGNECSIDVVPERPWLSARLCPFESRGWTGFLRWQVQGVATLRDAGYDALFVPGGLYLGTFRPFVTMFRNVLPFASGEKARYGLSLTRLRLELLKYGQQSTVKRADGLIFLSNWARRLMLEHTGPLQCPSSVVPHGVDARYRWNGAPKDWESRPFRWLYVSSIDPYKHQWHVVRAMDALRRRGYDAELLLVGPKRGPDRHSMKKLDSAIQEVDPTGDFVHYVGPVPYAEVAEYIGKADAFVFASTCENFPNTLLEAMAGGLPIASSNREPMRSILRDHAVFFDPEDPDDVARALEKLMEDPGLCARLSSENTTVATAMTWEKCAKSTWSFIARVAQA